MKTVKVSVDPDHPEPGPINGAANVVLSGGILAFPTDTSYGLGVNPYEDGAVSKVYKLKQRKSDKPLILLLSSPEQLEDLAQEISEDAKRLIEHFWPGPLTLIFPVSEELKGFLIGDTGKVGVRIPGNLIARKLIDACRIPVTATSANKSGQPSAKSAQDILDYFGNSVNMVLDGGPSTSEMESTVLDLTTTPFSLIREGRISADRIKAIIGPY